MEVLPLQTARFDSHFWFLESTKRFEGIIFWDASINGIAAVVGTVNSGYAYVPLDIKNPLKRNAAIIKDCKPSMMLISGARDEEYLWAL